MDIFKLLTRGIKEPTRKPGSAVAVPQLPSGSAPNPQLFHDDVGGGGGGGNSRGVKRKRGGVGETEKEKENAAEEEEEEDIDFFAPKKEAQKTATIQAKGRQDGDDDAGRVDMASSKAREPLDEDECRRILKSHRLKFTVLAGRVGPKPSKSSSNSKKAKKVKEEEKADTTKRKGKKEGDKLKKKDEKDEKEEEEGHKKQLYPQPLLFFPELRDIYGVSKQLLDNLTRQGFREPTEVQMGSLPLLLRPAAALATSADADVSVARGVDFLAVAPTGSGKTVTFLIPALNGILSRRRQPQGGEAGDEHEHVLSTVIVAPTRELASQIVNEGRKLALGTGIRVVLMRRGMRLAAEEVRREVSLDEDEDEDDNFEPSEQDEDDDDDEEDEEGEDSDGDDNEDEDEDDEDAEAGQDEREKGQQKKKRRPKAAAQIDILVTTPKLLLNFLFGKMAKPGKPISRKALPTVTSLVLDEADVLLDPVFRKQTLAIWRACTHPDLGLSFWSATMASGVESLIATQLEAHRKRQRRQEQEQEQGQDTTTAARPLVRLVVGIKDAAVPNVSHRLVWTLNEPGKLHELRNLLRPTSTATASSHPNPQSQEQQQQQQQHQALRPPFLVFTQTVQRAQSLHDEIKYDIPASAGGPSRVAVLHAGLRPAQRRSVMSRFRAGEIWVLITTDVLARGVDFAGVNGVVSYDAPSSAAAYVHRAGRTGRAGRAGGVAVTFWTKEDIPFVRSVANVIAASEKSNKNNGKDKDGSGSGIQDWLLAALPKTSKAEKRRLKVRGVEARRADGAQAQVTTKSAWERRREHNRQGAIEGSRRRKKMQRREERQQGEREQQQTGKGKGDEWRGFED